MNRSSTHRQPSDVSVEAGVVIVDGPDGLALTLTADAAEETGRRLIAAAEQARQNPQESSGSD